MSRVRKGRQININFPLTDSIQLYGERKKENFAFKSPQIPAIFSQVWFGNKLKSHLLMSCNCSFKGKITAVCSPCFPLRLSLVYFIQCSIEE